MADTDWRELVRGEMSPQTAKAINAVMEDIRADSTFQSHPRSYELLRYLVNQEMAGKGHEVDGYTIAQDILGRGAEFDPAESSLVRVQMFRLRRMLESYYEANPKWPRIVILPRSYRPEFEMGSEGSEIVGDQYATADDKGGGISDNASADAGANAAVTSLAGGSASAAIAKGGNERGDLNDSVRSEPSPSRDSGGKYNGTPSASTGREVHALTGATGARFGGDAKPKSRLFGRLRDLPVTNSPLLVSLAAVVMLMVGSALWNPSLTGAGSKSVEYVAPRVIMTVARQDPNFGELNNVKDELTRQLLWSHTPVTFLRSGDADYAIQIESQPYGPGKYRVLVQTRRHDGQVIGSRVFDFKDPDQPGSQNRLSQNIFDSFYGSDGIITNDLRYSNAHDPLRQELYGCYVDAEDYAGGRPPSSTTPAAIMRCLDPSKVENAKERAAIHLVRAHILSEALAGDTALGYPVSAEDVTAELDQASQAYPLESHQWEQVLVYHWRSPIRTDKSLRHITEQIERGEVDILDKYMLGVTYAYFLDDMERARPYARDVMAAIDDRSLSSRDIWSLVALPDALFAGDYELAQKYLKQSNGAEHATSKMLDLVLTCYLDAPSQEIAGKAATMGAFLAESDNTLKGFVKSRRYSPRLERKILGAFATPQCTRYANM